MIYFSMRCMQCLCELVGADVALETRAESPGGCRVKSRQPVGKTVREELPIFQADSYT